MRITRTLRVVFAILPGLAQPELAAAQGSAAAPPARPPAQIHVATGDARSYFTNAWWIESAQGLVLIDAMCLRSDVAKLIAAMRTTGKPLVAVILTHPHADHFGGLAQLKAAYPQASVIATAATADAMQKVHDEALQPGGWLRALGDEYERTLYRPDHIVVSGATLPLAGLTYTVRDYGRAEAENNSVIHLHEMNALFTGDLTVAGAAYYIGEQHSRQAMVALPKLIADFPTVVLAYSGHLAPQPLRAVVNDNLEELRFYRLAAAAEFADSASLTPTGALNDAAMRRLVRTYAGYLRNKNTYGMGPLAVAQMNATGIVAEMMADTIPVRVPPIHQQVRAGMRSLRFLLGRWTGSQTPGDTSRTPLPQPIEITSEVVPVLGGAAFEGRMTTPGYRFVLTFSYDVAQQLYRVAALDDVSGLLDIFEGKIGADGALTVDNLRLGTFYVNQRGERVHSRLRFAPTEGGLFRLDVSETVDRGANWTPSSHYVVSRRLVP
jgi:glyoxylase-like metal-dependent hydrolase (beta-lactamase superfamily II)